MTTAERRTTKAGSQMLVLTIGNERVSFFEEEDVNQPVAIGDAVTFALTRKGNYLNGKELAVVSKTPQQLQTAAQPPPHAQSPAASQPQSSAQLSPPPTPKPAFSPAKFGPGGRTILHALKAAELEHLYQEESTDSKAELARLGQISNQVRYARIEESLGELKDLLREILSLLQKLYLGKG